MVSRGGRGQPMIFWGSDNNLLHKLPVLLVGPGELVYSHRCTQRTVESLEHSPMGIWC